MRFASGRIGIEARGVLLLFTFAAFMLLPAGAFANKTKGAMEIGLSSYYATPSGDLDELDPNFNWGIIFQYWLTRTSTVTVGLESGNYATTMTVDGEDKGLNYIDTVIDVGFRYRPELDFVVSPYVEAAVGYHFWNTDPSFGQIDPRNGSGLAYIAGLGFEQDITHDLSYGLNLRYYYMPMRENLEESAQTGPAGGITIEKYPIRDVSYAAAGISLTYRIK